MINNNNYDWNISRKEGELLLINVFQNLLEENIKMTIHEICVMMSKELNNNNIKLFRNNKRRNLNNYMKIEFEGIHNFLNNHKNIFNLNDNIITLNYNYEE